MPTEYNIYIIKGGRIKETPNKLKAKDHGSDSITTWKRKNLMEKKVFEQKKFWTIEFPCQPQPLFKKDALTLSTCSPS